MKSKWMFILVMLFSLLACNFSGSATPTAMGAQIPVPTTNSPAGATPVMSSLTPAIPPTLTSTLPPTLTFTPTQVPVVHTLIPGEPPANTKSEITDRDSSMLAAEHRANGGENFSLNLYERPFNSQAMDQYFPQLDITKTKLSSDGKWTYVTIQLAGQGADGKMTGMYGVEFDLDVNGRGDVLVMTSNPGASWSTDGVCVWTDTNHDVGGQHPVMSDAPVSGDGYETQVFNQGVGTDPDIAWARVSPTDPKSVQIAIKPALIHDDDTYTWGAWAMDASTFNPAWFDYNDHFTLADAGSPLVEQTQYYPLKAFFEVDNTCRWAVGFTPTGSEPGICPVPPTPTPPPTATPKPTPTTPPVAQIIGMVYHDFNQNGFIDGTDFYYPGVKVQILSGSCAAPGGVVTTAVVSSIGWYNATVTPGTFCVKVPVMPADSNHGSGPVTVTVVADGTRRADFRFWLIIY